MRFVPRNLVNLLLIAVMVMPALSPPALRHSHPDGDQSHRHGIGTAERHRHSHTHGHANATKANHTHDDRVSQSPQSPVEHLHVFWFGFQTSLPLSAPDQSDSPRPTTSTEQWVPLISEISLLDVAQNGANILVADLLLPTGLTPRLPVRSEVRPPRESAVALLCDAARRERSGVLVI